MKARVAALAVSLVALAAGCPEDKTSTPPSLGFVGISASKATVVANGTNTVTLSVSNTTGGAVTVLTDRGTFSGGGVSATVAGASGTLTLVTCNATLDPTCAGTATVTASGGGAFGSVSITFGVLATMCSSNCAVDAGCPTLTCVGATGTGACSSTVPSACVVAAGGGGGGGTTETGITVTPARTRLPANGTATTEVVVEVTEAGAAKAGVAVTLSTTLGTLSATSGTTGADGTVTFTLTGSATPGVATLTATSTAPAGTATATVTIPRLGVIQLADPAATPAVLGAKGSGVDELGSLQVQVLDDMGQPYPDGLAVRFEHRRLGGSSFVAPLTADTATCVAAAGCIGYQGVTTSGADAPDSDGLAVAWIYSGNVAGTLAVTASTTAGGVTRSTTLPTVAVIGARANGANFSIVCGPRNVPALAETDCAVSLVDAPFTCVALLKDRYGNLLGTPTQVIFASEAAGVGPVATTPAYDPATAPASQSELGSAVQIFNTLGAGLPFDVGVQAGEPSVSHGRDGCGVRTHNPRDGAVAVVAMADGEEAFFDANGNGVYDAGEPFVDQGEPFVDANDDGVWNDATATTVREWYLDVNGSGTYTAGNTIWDGSAKLWTQTVVVYTGEAMELDAGAGNLLGARWATAGVAGCTATAPDPGFTVTAAATGTPPIPAGFQDHYVYASDLNLNMLHSGATYGITVEAGGVTVRYWGFPAYADDLGFFYRYWPCDSAGANCASQCRVTGAGLPCTMRPSLSSFTCGPVAAVTITGGDKAESAAVSFSVDTPYSVYGTGKTARYFDILPGVVTP